LEPSAETVLAAVEPFFVEGTATPGSKTWKGMRLSKNLQRMDGEALKPKTKKAAAS
jgi:hypothetical protein